MAPKKKANKKNDDWESEALGESPDPIAQASADAKAEEDAQQQDQDEDENAGGGLMATLRKNKAKKNKKSKQDDFVDGEDPPEVDSAEPAVDLAAKAPIEATAEDEDVFGQPLKKKGKSAASKDTTPDAPDNSDDDADDADDTGRVKTKKEKEKEKKEREKLRKKQQAATKKKVTPAGETSAPTDSTTQDTPIEAPAPEAGGKKKKLNPALAALQKKQEERRQREQAEAQALEDERRAEEDQRKREEEENARTAEQKAARKEKEKAKLEQLKKEGKYKTKAQKEADARNTLRLKQMMESNAVSVAGLGDDQTAAEKKSADKRKRNPKKVAEEARAQEAAAAQEEAARQKLEQLRLAEEKAEAEKKAAAEAQAQPKEEETEDWEALADQDDHVPAHSNQTIDSISTDLKAVAPAVNGDATHKDSSDSDSDSDTDSDDSDDSDSSEDEAKTLALRKKEESAARRKQQMADARAAASTDNLRSPICCILGHVDTGKTKLLDKIRQTNVQEGEAGGITQQIGATYFPVEALRKKTAVVNENGAFEFKVPGLLVIDTPGHESFSNLRSRGSSLCNIAILVVDIMHGLEPQTLESMKLLRDRKTPFIVALNKIDRLYGWKKIDNNGFQDSLALQSKSVQAEFADRLEKTKLAFAEQSFNAELYYENKSMAKFVSLVPTSAHTGEGIPDMIKLLVSLTQERMTNQLMYLSEVECTVLEVKVVEGHGTTIDVILSNGVLREDDRIVLCGTNGAIKTKIRALLTPAEMKELRVKSQYVHNSEVKAALGVKISAAGLENAIAGSRMLVARPEDDEDDLEEDVMSDLDNLMSKITKTGRGVTVQASTLGSLEALLEFLKVSKIPVANLSIGPVYKRDVITTSAMLEKAKEFAVMLCFDVKVDKDAQEEADKLGVKIFTADIIYHLFDNFTKHMTELAEQRKEESKMLAVFPCVLQPIQVFNKKDPIVIGVDVIDGALRINTPIAAVQVHPTTGVKTVVPLGRV